MIRKSTLSLAAVMALFLVVAPVLAGPRVIRDTFDARSGTGVAVLQMSDALFAEVVYRDMDQTQSFTSADHKISVRYFRRGGRAPGSRVPLRPSF